jgi:uncharacterized protein YjbJ (UPF0337 family)
MAKEGPTMKKIIDKIKAWWNKITGKAKKEEGKP